MTEELAALIKRYRRTPEFMFSDLNGVSSTGMTGDTLLHLAVISASREDVDLLIRSGAKVNARGDLGNTPLHHAASRGLFDIANKLIASGANMQLTNEFGQTPADLATLMRHNELAQRLRVKESRLLGWFT
ncbi:MAG: ankyrin repeat domain-containing protein [Candidatus Sulfotelmatobacter sp.]